MESGKLGGKLMESKKVDVKVDGKLMDSWNIKPTSLTTSTSAVSVPCATTARCTSCLVEPATPGARKLRVLPRGSRALVAPHKGRSAERVWAKPSRRSHQQWGPGMCAV